MASLVEQVDTMQHVGKLHMQGYNATEIARQLDIPRTRVKKLIDEWQNYLREYARSNLDIKDRVMAVLYEVDEHWKLVVKESWKTVEQADQQGQLSNKTGALKLIASINKDRAQLFQQAGVNQDSELIEELNEAQHTHEILIGLLKELRSEHPEIADLINARLASIQSEVEVVAIEGGDDQSANTD